MFRITYSGTILDLKQPACGCSPRPLNIPGGSTTKLETFSTELLKRQVRYFASISAFSIYSRFFSSVGRFRRISRCLSKCCFIWVKSKSANEVAPRERSKRRKKFSVKFFITSSFSANSVPWTYAHQLQTSSTSGFKSRGVP